MRNQADTENKACFKTSIGGQAILEGIMMRGPEKEALVVRTQDGLIEKVETLNPIKKRFPVLGAPIIRGAVNFIDSMVHGVKAVMFSADYYMEDGEPEEPSKFDLWVEKKFGHETAGKILTTVAVVVALGFSVLLFFMLPTLIAGFFGGLVQHAILRNLMEGLIRIAIFLTYMFLVSRTKDIKRLFSYHGAEHKTIFCYERGLSLTVENVRAMPRQHPRCGTSFLLIVMVISILVFAVVRWSNVWVRMVMRLLLLPVVVGISYEITRYVGRHDNKLTRIMTAPGLWLQNLTTNEPDDDMIEVAIRAMELVIPAQKGADNW